MSTADDSVRHIFRGSPFLEQAQAYSMEMDFRPFIREMIMEPGLKDLLHRLKPLVGLAVATNRSNTIDKVLAWHGLEGFFDIVVSALDVLHPKPHPECLHKILGFFGLLPGEALYVGDSVIDEETAQRAGVPFAAYRNPRLRAAYHVDRLEKIAGMVKKTGPGDNRS
jgi:HAD superfamily hydrolase (TIGR01509 family)